MAAPDEHIFHGSEYQRSIRFFTHINGAQPNMLLLNGGNEAPMNELEIIQYPQIKGLSIFFDTVEYRTSHFHLDWELVWLLKNPLSVTCGQSKFILQPGQMVLFGSNEPHEFHKVNESATFLCIQVSPQLFPNLPPMSIEEKYPHMFLSEGEMQQVKQGIWKMADAYARRKENYDLYCTGICCLIFHRLLSALPTHILTPEESACIDKRNLRLQRLINFVGENYMHKIRLSDFAAMEHRSVSYLSHFIKDTMNQTFQEYVTSVRFNCACKLIAAGGKQMLDICMESGFSDYRYFCREFRRQYNMTPEQYSQFKKKTQLDTNPVRHSIHSTERFYSTEESLQLLSQNIFN